MIIDVVKKKRSQLVQGIERLCDAYITLAYMDASKHKTDKSQFSLIPSSSDLHIKIPASCI